MFVDSIEGLKESLRLLSVDLSLQDTQTNNCERLLACDFEGVNLCREGELCLGQFATPSRVILIDFVALGQDAFTTSWEDITLRWILTSPCVTKIIFDPRCDSDALFAQFDILMEGVICLQLMNIAVRRKSGRDVTYCPGLVTVLRSNDFLDAAERDRIATIKDKGKDLFRNDSGIWKSRPLPQLLLEYSEADAAMLLPLYHHHRPQLNDYWMNLVQKHSDLRVKVCQDANFKPGSRSQCFAPRF